MRERCRGRWRRFLRLGSIDQGLGWGKGERIKPTLEDEEIEDEGVRQWPAGESGAGSRSRYPRNRICLQITFLNSVTANVDGDCVLIKSIN